MADSQKGNSKKSRTHKVSVGINAGGGKLNRRLTPVESVLMGYPLRKSVNAYPKRTPVKKTVHGLSGLAEQVAGRR